jgi:hypothetical protein
MYLQYLATCTVTAADYMYLQYLATCTVTATVDDFLQYLATCTVTANDCLQYLSHLSTAVPAAHAMIIKSSVFKRTCYPEVTGEVDVGCPGNSADTEFRGIF